MHDGYFHLKEHEGGGGAHTEKTKTTSSMYHNRAMAAHIYAASPP